MSAWSGSKPNVQRCMRDNHNRASNSFGDAQKIVHVNCHVVAIFIPGAKSCRKCVDHHERDTAKLI